VAVFVHLFHFLLLFLLVVSFVSYFLLLKGVSLLLFVTFLLVVTFNNYFLLLRRARVKGSIHCATGELERVQVDFFLIFFTIEGKGGGSYFFFSPDV